MTRAWFSGDLETVATFWRVWRRDGVTLGFTTHDRDLWFDGINHQASPGMVPSAIRKSADLSPDSAEVLGALTHDAIRAADIAAGRFDGAAIAIGVVDWDSGEAEMLYRGSIGVTGEEGGQFSADLVSRKAELLRDPVRRTSPTCRAVFCGPGCNLNPEKFTQEVTVADIDFDANAVQFAPAPTPADCRDGAVRWLEGAAAGLDAVIVAASDTGWFVLDAPLHPGLAIGVAARLRAGCNRTLDTCAVRFGNAINFQGEPYLPGNDLLVRYPTPPS
ncbi:DUF2163 domain-containing protein [Novosphingobium colocasiae]|uniref:Bacteriophage phiJL001 Gp84 C-terminal domain-containing protein n=1 Tax=Novosphingobium colocasiae TaxID=1256513 RepID=A0A918UFD0_9SPHN|nr:DUF2163 domain-containing protein [Novosphingobium colocasiae]GGY99646.1 hypothetical protein GCM10011614_13260 [Novosphingobium colocasiae]